MSFSQFVSVDTPMRVVYLQRLSIAISYVWSSRIAEMLCKIFRHATHLDELCILDCGFLEGYPEVPATIAALKSLRTFVIRQPTQSARDMLARMTSRVTKVDISFSRIASQRFDPVELLAPWRKSLAALCISLPNFTHVRPGLQYTALTKLVLKCHDCIPAASVLYHYPNVRHFTVTMCVGECGHGGVNAKIIRWDDTEIEAMRASNGHPEVDSWPLLDVLTGDIPAIYHLALKCPVRRLDLNVTSHHRLGSVLQDVKPKILKLSQKMFAFDKNSLTSLTQQMQHELRSLTIRLEVVYLDEEIQSLMVR